ncbi:S8 family peptidase [Paenibacillus pini]|nr:S8 family peptidase [Paenibacillus pini]
MSRRKWAGLGILIGAFSVMLLLLIPRGDTNPQASQQVSPLNPKQEQQSKQRMMAQDIASTDKLTRVDTQQHLTTMLNSFQHANPVTIKKQVQELQKYHDHFSMLIWQDAETKQNLQFKMNNYSWNAEDQKQLNHYLNQSKIQMQNKHFYESPSFQMAGKQYFVMSEAASGNDKSVTVLINQKILNEVAKHQKKNLRMIPYPKEGKFRVESIHPDTLKELTVETGHDNENASHYYENEIVVHFRTEPSRQDMNTIMSDIKAVSSRKIGYTYIFRSGVMRYEELKTYFQKKWSPQYVEPHFLYLTNENADGMDSASNTTVPIVPNDLLFAKYQWNLPAIEASKGWNLSRGSKNIIVAIVDTGVDIDHPDLKGQLLEGYNVIDPGSDPMDDVGHGTHVAGIIGALVNNNEGVAGISWYNKILPVKALDKSGSGTTYSVAEGIIWATDHGAKVINLSLGNYADSEFLHDAIKYAYDRDVVIVAASGNDNTERPGYPAAYPEVLAVAATDQNYKRASFSNYGNYIDVAAPGTSIASTYPGNQYAALSGTSMASPHVTAMAALIRSKNPELTNKQVMDIMRSNTIDLGTKGHDSFYGYGQIDIYKALQAAGSSEAPLQFWPQHVQKQLNSVH